MKPTPNDGVEKYRLRRGRLGTDETWGNNGVFIVPGPERQKLFCIVSDEKAWEHVSVSVATKKRLPTWGEMCWVKDLWWLPEEEVIQIHPRQSEYVNYAEALHLWRPIGLEIVRPPHTMVGPQNVDEGLGLLKEMYTPRAGWGV